MEQISSNGQGLHVHLNDSCAPSMITDYGIMLSVAMDYQTI